MSNLRTRLTGAALLFAQDCLLCAAPSGHDPVCADCSREFPCLPPACPRCAMPTSGGILCGACLRRPPAFDRTIAAWRYAPPVDGLVHALKFGGRLAVAPLFGRALALRIDGIALVDVIVPMPLAPARLSTRGFNQALEIARHVAKAVRRPFATDLLDRRRETAPQSDLPRTERARNVRDAFLSRADLAGARIAVVDDVMTTGATLHEAARALRRAGATWVENWVVGRAIGDV